MSALMPKALGHQRNLACPAWLVMSADSLADLGKVGELVVARC